MNTALSYFTGEQHSEIFEQIVQLAEELGYSVRVYESKNSSQFDFLQAIYRDTATIVDATIPNDLTQSTVYPILTAQINCVDHILVFSDKYYEDGTQILPLNITPQRVRKNTDRDVLAWLRFQLKDLKENQYYERFEIESIEALMDYKERMEKVLTDSIEMHKPKKGAKTRVMISYRSSCNKEVELFRKEMEANHNVEIKVLSPGSLCDDYEAHSPMRRWMLVGMLDDHIRGVDEMWVYYNDIYSNSWWTLAEMVMTAYVNYDRDEKNKVNVKVYDAANKRFLERGEKNYPEFLHVSLSKKQFQKIARLLSNTRPDAMGPENSGNIRKLKMLAWAMRLMSKNRRAFLVEQLRPILEMSVPSTLSEDERKDMIDGMIEMYSDPNEILKYANDDVFKDKFWYNISYQTDAITASYKDGVINVDAFIETPMQELTKFKDENLRAAANKNSEIKIREKKYDVSEGKKRYLWLATRMGKTTVKDAPGLEILQTYNLHEEKGMEKSASTGISVIRTRS